MDASYNKSFELVKCLVDKGADINMKSKVSKIKSIDVLYVIKLND